MVCNYSTLHWDIISQTIRSSICAFRQWVLSCFSFVLIRADELPSNWVDKYLSILSFNALFCFKLRYDTLATWNWWTSLFFDKLFTCLCDIFLRGARALKLIMWTRCVVLETWHLLYDDTLVSLNFLSLNMDIVIIHENIGELDNFCLGIYFCQWQWQNFPSFKIIFNNIRRYCYILLVN